jgi:hypothetical protein
MNVGQRFRCQNPDCCCEIEVTKTSIKDTPRKLEKLPAAREPSIPRALRVGACLFFVFGIIAQLYLKFSATQLSVALLSAGSPSLEATVG